MSLELRVWELLTEHVAAPWSSAMLQRILAARISAALQGGADRSGPVERYERLEERVLTLGHRS